MRRSQVDYAAGVADLVLAVGVDARTPLIEDRALSILEDGLAMSALALAAASVQAQVDPARTASLGLVAVLVAGRDDSRAEESTARDRVRLLSEFVLRSQRYGALRRWVSRPASSTALVSPLRRIGPRWDLAPQVAAQSVEVARRLDLSTTP